MRFNTFHEITYTTSEGSFRHVPINSLKQRFGISKPIVGYELNIFSNRSNDFFPTSNHASFTPA